jgi:hypothetical protein
MDFQIAQLNIARALASLDDPLLADFIDGLDPINALADDAPGFVWRLQDETGDATTIRAFDDDLMIVNMSVWESIDSLAQFVYRSGHVSVMRRRREWFERLAIHLVLWWVPTGHTPTVAEAKQRLAWLELYGPTPDAFTFKVRFPTPDASAPVVDDEIGCPA